MWTLTRSGSIAAPVSGPHHCAKDDGPIWFDWRISISASKLDANSFVIRAEDLNTFVAHCFLPVVTDSCEILAQRIAYHIIRNMPNFDNYPSWVKDHIEVHIQVTGNPSSVTFRE